MKVALYSPISLTNFSGAAKFLCEFALLLAKKGYDVEVYASPWGPNRVLSIEEVREILQGISYAESHKALIDANVTYVNYIPFIWRKAKIRSRKIAGIHTPLLFPSQHFLETMLHPHGAGVEWFCKTLLFTISLPIVYADLMFFDAIHIPNKSLKIGQARKMHRIPLFIDVNKCPFDLNKDDKFTVLFAGRHTWEKGWYTFQKIARRLKAIGHDFRFTCTGKGNDNIEGLGFLREEELLYAYSKSHIVVYPSIADVFSLVLLEAMICGTPVITTPIPAHTGAELPLFYARTLNEFVRAITYVYELWLRKPEKYKNLCMKCHVSGKKYDVRVVFPKYEDLLRRVALGLG